MGIFKLYHNLFKWKLHVWFCLRKLLCMYTCLLLLNFLPLHFMVLVVSCIMSLFFSIKLFLLFLFLSLLHYYCATVLLLLIMHLCIYIQLVKWSHCHCYLPWIRSETRTTRSIVRLVSALHNQSANPKMSSCRPKSIPFYITDQTEKQNERLLLLIKIRIQRYTFLIGRRILSNMRV